MSLALANYWYPLAPLLSPVLLAQRFEQNHQFNPALTNIIFGGYPSGSIFDVDFQSGYSFNNDAFNLDKEYLPILNRNNGYSFQYIENQLDNGFTHGDGEKEEFTINMESPNGFKNNAYDGFNSNHGFQNEFVNSYFQYDKEQTRFGINTETKNDPQEIWANQWKSHLEKVAEEENERKKKNIQDIRRLILLMVPFFFFDKPTASYFVATKLLSSAFRKLGVHDAANMLILLGVQCVDIVALSRGRFKLVEDYEDNWYQTLYSNTLTQLGISDLIRIGTQFFMPQAPKPTYEERR